MPTTPPRRTTAQVLTSAAVALGPLARQEAERAVPRVLELAVAHGCRRWPSPPRPKSLKTLRKRSPGDGSHRLRGVKAEQLKGAAALDVLRAAQGSGLDTSAPLQPDWVLANYVR